MKYQARFPNPVIEKHFRKDLGLLPKDLQEEILNAVRSLEDVPRPFGQKPFKQLNPPVAIYNFAAQYRVRVRDYRVLYDVDDRQKVVWIYVLRKRNEKTYK